MRLAGGASRAWHVEVSLQATRKQGPLLNTRGRPRSDASPCSAPPLPAGHKLCREFLEPLEPASCSHASWAWLPLSCRSSQDLPPAVGAPKHRPAPTPPTEGYTPHQAVARPGPQAQGRTRCVPPGRGGLGRVTRRRGNTTFMKTVVSVTSKALQQTFL